MGLAVNGTVITRTQSFPITGSFDVYQHSVLQVHLQRRGQLHQPDRGLRPRSVAGGPDDVTPATASVPAGPTNLRATAGGQVGGPELDRQLERHPSYYRSTAAPSPTARRSPRSRRSPDATTFTDTGLTNGRTYFYFVQAFNAVGGSAHSNEVSAIPAAGGGGPTAPAPPTGLNAVPGNGSVGLSWAASAGATSYSVYRGTSPGGQGSTAIGTATGTSFTDTGLTNGTRYYYKVRAANAAGSSGLSAEVSAVPGTTGSPPGVPFGVVITPRTGNILLQWGFMSAATGYNVYRATSPGAETLLIRVTSPTYIDTAVTPGVTYYYQFTATNAGGESARTAEFPATAR